LEDLIDTDGGPEHLALAQRALATVQKLDPPGVGARDLRECWLLQLTPKMPLYEQLQTIIAHHLDDFGEQPPAANRQAHGLFDRPDPARARRVAEAEPQARVRFRGDRGPQCHADVFIEETDKGGYSVRLEDTRTPNLYISPTIANCSSRRTPTKKPANHQAENQLGPMAD